MRKLLTIGVGLVTVMLAIAGPPFVALSVRPFEAPLRVEMQVDDAHLRLLASGADWNGAVYWDESRRNFWREYVSKPDIWGNQQLVSVYSDPHQERITKWEVVNICPTRSPWLAWALKAVGW
jgi:hypothetical protein